MAARNGVFGANDQLERNGGRFEDVYPALLILLPFGHVTNQAIEDVLALLILNQRPKMIDLLFGGLRIGAKDL